MSRYTQVKICGVTSVADALLAARAGADLLGLNFYRRSPRFLSLPQARAISAGLRDASGEQRPLLVGIFVNETPARIAQICAQVGLDSAQLSGDETPDMLCAPELRAVHVFKSLRPRTVVEAQTAAGHFATAAAAAARLPTLLLDAWHPGLYGGSGVQAGEDVARVLIRRVPRLMLAGGLDADNIGERLRALQPWGVDVASGVESAPGVKDADKVQAFITAVRISP